MAGLTRSRGCRLERSGGSHGRNGGEDTARRANLPTKSATGPEAKRRGERDRRYRCRLDVWLADVMGMEGIAIPYGAPNASPHIERLNRTLREEALNHFMFLNAKHVRHVCSEYRDFYNGARPSQALHGIPEPYPELREAPLNAGKLVALPVLGGVQHD